MDTTPTPQQPQEQGTPPEIIAATEESSISVDTSPPRSSCCDLGPNSKLVIGTLLGCAIGVGTSFFSPTEEQVTWLSFPGKLFLRALSCLVVPLIFCNMVTGIAEISKLGGTGKIGSRTIGMYMLTTVFAVGMGALFTAIFMPFYTVETNQVNTSDPKGSIALECDNGLGHLTVLPDGSVVCKPGSTYTFGAEALGDHFVVNSGLQGRSLSDTITGIFFSLVPQNVTQAFLTPDILSVVVFASFFGIVAGRMEMNEGETNRVLEFMEQLARLFNRWIGHIISLAPYAIVFMIAGALAGADDIVSLMKNIGVFVLTVFLGLVCHVLVSLCVLFFGVTRQNPFAYLFKISPVYMFAFGSASSAATLPLSIQYVETKTSVPAPVAKFVLSLGSTINMDGSGVYFVSAMVFLAIVSGHEALLTPVAFFNIILMSTVGAVGASPIPNAGLIMILTIWETCFPGVTTPVQISYLIAIDWFLDRCITVANVCGDTMLAQIITSMNLTLDQQKDGKNDGELALSKEEQQVLDHHVTSKLRDYSVTKSKSLISHLSGSKSYRYNKHSLNALALPAPTSANTSKSVPPLGKTHSNSQSRHEREREEQEENMLVRKHEELDVLVRGGEMV